MVAEIRVRDSNRWVRVRVRVRVRVEPMDARGMEQSSVRTSVRQASLSGGQYCC